MASGTNSSRGESRIALGLAGCIGEKCAQGRTRVFEDRGQKRSISTSSEACGVAPVAILLAPRSMLPVSLHVTVRSPGGAVRPRELEISVLPNRTVTLAFSPIGAETEFLLGQPLEPDRCNGRNWTSKHLPLTFTPCPALAIRPEKQKQLWAAWVEHTQTAHIQTLAPPPVTPLREKAPEVDG